MLLEYKDVKGIQKTIEIPIEQSHFDTIKQQVQGVELEDLEDWEFWKLRDYLYKILIIESFQDQIIEFFTKVHLQQYEFKEGYEKLSVNAVDVYYHFYYGESIYLFVEPSWVFFTDEIVKNRLEVHLDYDTEELENILEQILDAFGVNYENWKEEGDALSEDELDLGGMFCDVLFDCWSISKKETNSSVVGMLSYATGGGGYRGLNTQDDITQTDEGIRTYVEKIKRKN